MTVLRPNTLLIKLIRNALKYINSKFHKNWTRNDWNLDQYVKSINVNKFNTIWFFFSKKMKDRFFNLNVGFPLLSMTAAILRGTLSTRFWKIWTSILYHSSWSICFLAMVYETKSFFLIHHKYVQLDSYQGFGQPGKTYYIISFLSTFYHTCCMNGWTALHKM